MANISLRNIPQSYYHDGAHVCLPLIANTKLAEKYLKIPPKKVCVNAYRSFWLHTSYCDFQEKFKKQALYPDILLEIYVCQEHKSVLKTMETRNKLQKKTIMYTQLAHQYSQIISTLKCLYYQQNLKGT